MHPDAGTIQQRVSHRARRMRIDVSARHGVVVVVPAGTSPASIADFVEAKREWIERACDRVRARTATRGSRVGPAVPEVIELRALGETWQVVRANRQRPRLRAEGSTLHIPQHAEATRVRQTLMTWLKETARSRLSPRLADLADRHDLRYQRISVRGQRTRWASCSGRGTISLNYKLLFLPPVLVDHVLLHELAHTRHLNHSQRFWRLLSRLDPDWEENHAAMTDAGQWLPAWVEMDD